MIEQYGTTLFLQPVDEVIAMIKIGVVGFGLRAGGIYKILKEVDPEFCLGGIVDPDEKRVRQELPENERNVDFYSDIAGLAGRGKVDALLIGTRCNLHTELAVEALKYDIPVWLEKPVAISMEQALALEQACREKQDRILVSFPLRATPLYERAKEILDSGRLGKVVHFNAVNYVSYGGVYFETAYRNFEVTQGLFLQKATHDFDYLCRILNSPIRRIAALWSRGQIFGGDKPEGLRCGECGEVETCMESPLNRMRGDSGGDIKSHLCPFSSRLGTPESGMNEDASSALIELENGIHGVYSQVFFTRRAAWRGATFSGYWGTLSFDWPSAEIHLTEHFAPFATVMNAPKKNSHFGGDYELGRNFRDMILKGRAPLAGIADGLNSVYACLAAKESAETGEFVNVRHFGDAFPADMKS